MAWTNLVAGDTDANSPLNETLMAAIRENMAETMRSKILLERFHYYSNGGALTYELNASELVVGGGGSTTLAIYRVYIPNGITTLQINVFAQSTVNDANNGVRVTINGVNRNFYNLPAPYAWQGEASLAPGISGFQNVTLIGINNSAGNKTIACRGITIRADA